MVTGSTGFIGMHLCTLLADRGFSVHALYRSDQKAKKLPGKNIRLFRGNLFTTDVLEEAMRGCTWVFHLAGLARPWARDPGDFYRINVKGTRNVFECALKTGVKKVIFTSTAGVYKPSATDFITEESRHTPEYYTPYEHSKALAGEIIPGYIDRGLDIVAVYPTRVFGPGPLTESNWVARMICLYIKGSWRIIPGRGRSIANFVHVYDAAMGHLLAAEKGKAGEKYLIGGTNVDYNELLDLLNRQSGRRFWMIRIPLWAMLAAGHAVMIWSRLTGRAPLVTPGHIRKFNHSFRISVQKAEKQLGYRPGSFNERLQDVIRFCRERSASESPESR